MNSEEFFAMINKDSLTFDERIEIIETTAYDMTTDDQPWCMLQRFDCINDSNTPIEDAFKVANAVKNRLGPLVISRESSYCLCKFQTIMDDFDSMMNTPKSFWIGMLRYAFRKTGFIYAREASQHDLFQKYCKTYGNTFANGESIEIDV